MNTQKIKAVYQNFLSKKAEDAIITATLIHKWLNDRYFLELSDKTGWRVLLSTDIGNGYDSDGILLSIPPMDDDEFDECDYNHSITDRCLDLLNYKFNEAIKET